MAHLFIAYHYEALETACAIQRRIEALGYSAALNPDPQAGETWQPWIERELERAFAVLALQSPAASASPFVTYEWARSLGAGIEVIPVVLGAAALHPRLGNNQHPELRRIPAPRASVVGSDGASLLEPGTVHRVVLDRSAVSDVQGAVNRIATVVNNGMPKDDEGRQAAERIGGHHLAGFQQFEMRREIGGARALA